MNPLARAAFIGSLTLGAPTLASEHRSAQERDGQVCALVSVGSDAMTTDGCLACHSGREGPPIRSSHPVGIYRMGPGRRTLDEVVRRGVLVPAGRIECVTCHDRRSPWKDHIALPPGAPAVPAVDRRDPATYENRRSWRMAGATSSPPLPEGSAVSAAPLCAACHTFAD